MSEPNYEPMIHFDVYGSLGRAFGHDARRIADFIMKLEEAVRPYTLQIEKMARLREQLRQAKARTKIIADEWCNTFDDIQAFADAAACDLVQVKTPDLGNVIHTIEAMLYCKTRGIGVYLGGSCNETSLSARISVEIALATQADQMLAKPGMGLDEALMIVQNHMARVLRRIDRVSPS